MDPNQLRQQKAKVVAEAQGIEATAKTENREMTDDESTKVVALLDQADGYESHAKAIEAKEALSTRLSGAVDGLTKPQLRIAPDSVPGHAEIVKVVGKAPWDKIRSSGKLVAFMGADARENAYKAGRWIQAAIFGNHEAAQWCSEHGVGIGAAMGETSNAAGGLFVPDELTNAIIDLRETFGLARRECRVASMSSDSQLIPRRAGGVTAYAVGENLEITKSDASFNQVELNARKWAALTLISNELMEDAVIDMADWVAQEMAHAFAEKEDDALFNGDGGADFHGINGIRNKIVDGTHTTGAVDATSGDDQFGELIGSDFAALTGVIPSWAVANAKWYISSQGYALSMLRLMEAAGGNTMTTIADGIGLSYLGFPVVLTPKMPTVSTALNNVAMVVFGDMRQSVTFGDRRGFRMAVLRERYAEFDQTGVVATERMDINVHELGDNTNAGGLVALIGQS